jgi:signal transduction histidine kinase
VQDNGPGVPIIERHLLFVPNSGLSPKPTGGEASHGVGLALVKRLIESENGIVEAAFPPEGGSVFAFEVPAA